MPNVYLHYQHAYAYAWCWDEDELAVVKLHPTWWDSFTGTSILCEWFINLILTTTSHLLLGRRRGARDHLNCLLWFPAAMLLHFDGYSHTVRHSNFAGLLFPHTVRYSNFAGLLFLPLNLNPSVSWDPSMNLLQMNKWGHNFDAHSQHSCMWMQSIMSHREWIPCWLFATSLVTASSVLFLLQLLLYRMSHAF